MTAKVWKEQFFGAADTKEEHRARRCREFHDKVQA
jgi:hypothetical protein